MHKSRVRIPSGAERKRRSSYCRRAPIEMDITHDRNARSRAEDRQLNAVIRGNAVPRESYTHLTGAAKYTERNNNIIVRTNDGPVYYRKAAALS